ncbi:hypothetical protein GCM10023221_18090 [Luteimicrobium xylanilyticum]
MIVWPVGKVDSSSPASALPEEHADSTSPEAASAATSGKAARRRREVGWWDDTDGPLDRAPAVPAPSARERVAGTAYKVAPADRGSDPTGLGRARGPAGGSGQRPCQSGFDAKVCR